jgi:tRNA dimethylallyltransferase
MSAARTANSGFAAEGGPGSVGPGFSPDTKTAKRMGALAPETSPTRAARLPLAVLLLGPTGSGKTALSLALAESFNGEIVSCDSVAVYRGMELGTAKPTLEERARIPHHLIDVAEPDKPYTAGAYMKAARAALHEIAARGKLPIVTGGTGLYLRALTEGLFAGPARQESLRARLGSKAEKRGSAWLHRILDRLDPASAARIHANDAPKLIRAIEVCLASRRPMSEVMARDPLTGFRLLRIGLNPPRAALYQRLNVRCAAMFAAGLIEETRGLLARYGPVKALDSLGYRQAMSALNGALSLEDAIKAAQQGHRNYAKRQLTWFRREPDVHWIAGFGDSAETMHVAADLVASRIYPDAPTSKL